MVVRVLGLDYSTIVERGPDWGPWGLFVHNRHPTHGAQKAAIPSTSQDTTYYILVTTPSAIVLVRYVMDNSRGYSSQFSRGVQNRSMFEYVGV